MISACPPTIVVSVVLPVAVVPGAVPVFLVEVCVLAVFATELPDGVDAVVLEPPLGGAVVTCDERPHAVVTSARALAAVNKTNPGLLRRTVQAYAARFSRAQTCPAARSERRS